MFCRGSNPKGSMAPSSHQIQMTAPNNAKKPHGHPTTVPRKRLAGYSSTTSPISPPPLKRQRTSPSKRFLSTSDFPQDVPAIPRPAASETTSQYLGREKAPIDKSNQPKKHIYRCRCCEKKITREFDPMRLCPSCKRPYHDSCFLRDMELRSTE